MTDRRPVAISIVLLLIAVAVCIGTIVVARNNNGPVARRDANGSAAHGAESMSNGGGFMERGSITAKNKMPQDIELLEATPDGSVTGQIICGNCSFKTGDDCNVMIHDEKAHHLVTVLPNDKYSELNGLIGDT